MLSSLTKKYLMALSGLALVGFVFAHMAGNLQMFISQDLMNDYAYKLQNLPYGLLWIARGGLLAAAVVHVLMAISLTRENRAAKPGGNSVKATVQASSASQYMGVSGSILLFFIVFHLLHFTTQSIYPEYKTMMAPLGDMVVHDVYGMVIAGFSKTWVALFYIVAMGLLCWHLSHGVSSMFQSLGLRNKNWQPRLDLIAKLYGLVIFLGFASIPFFVLVSKMTNFNIFPA